MQNLRSFVIQKVVPTFIALLILIVTFLAIMYGSVQFLTAITTGLFVRWEPLPDFPTQPVEIIPSIYRIWVRDINDKIYTIAVFTSNEEERDRWYEVMEPIPEDWLSPYPPCTREELPTSIYGSPPTGLLDCQSISYGPEAGSSYVVLDDQEQLWLFRNMNVGTGLLLLLPCLFGGALVVSLLFTRWSMKKVTRFFAQSDHYEPK